MCHFFCDSACACARCGLRVHVFLTVCVGVEVMADYNGDRWN